MSSNKKEKILKTYFHYVLQKKWLYIVLMVIVLILGFFDGYFPFLYGNLVDQLGISAFEEGKRLILTLIFIYAIRGVIEELMYYIWGYVGYSFLERKPKTDYVKKIQSLDFKFHSSKSTGSLISISSRIDTALGTILGGLNIWGLIHIIDILISSYFIFQIDPYFALIYSSTFFVAFVVGYPLLKWNIKIRKKVNDESDKIGGVISDNMLGFETVKAFSQENYEIERLNKRFDIWQKQCMKYLLSFRFFNGSIYLVTLVSVVILILMAFNRVSEGLWTTGMLVTIIGYANGLIWKAFNLIFKARDYMKASVDLQKFVNIMNTKPAIEEKVNARKIGEISKGIDFKDVSFTYTESEDGEEKTYVLENINFKIKLNKTVALVGKSGSGKTTLAKLLMRYYDVDKGSITINGIDIRDLELRSLRKSIGLVPQDPIMFNESIKYNISYGNPKASMTRIRDAAKNAALDIFIDSLPKGYDTIVGERGIKLSGGQRQRLAIARVMLENPEIIIFDEATSQLDSENERAIQEAFKNLTEDKTTVIIAHRLSTIMHADKIVVFDEGKITETGTHEQLMSTEGIYSFLWKLQTEN
jgi:ATP-binding cassette subfamily B protein